MARDAQSKAVADQVRMMESGRSTRLDDMVNPSTAIRPDFVMLPCSS